MRTPPSLTTLPVELQRLICETVLDRPTLRTLNVTSQHFCNMTDALLWRHITMPLSLLGSTVHQCLDINQLLLTPPPHRSIGGYVQSICITIGFWEHQTLNGEEHQRHDTAQEAKRLIKGIRLCPRLRRLEFFLGGESEPAQIFFHELEKVHQSDHKEGSELYIEMPPAFHRNDYTGPSWCPSRAIYTSPWVRLELTPINSCAAHQFHHPIPSANTSLFGIFE
ncbi:uncharacterized protein EI90DRAFT_3055755 [Cantharellus anzutake]|uniref:uncharacterized protein n=1 Tax=Cantharellus anzutake TaxID=1750568 RepID=UPI001903F50B|nr:uncharacterized protein EI90DRAFT_3055755 [Cantharellus anzutake]KAF8331888.1 hypothetical protein EI90DRAFT_3055755 [Cantharellus anzutake]